MSDEPTVPTREDFEKSCSLQPRWRRAKLHHNWVDALLAEVERLREEMDPAGWKEWHRKLICEIPGLERELSASAFRECDRAHVEPSGA